MSLFKRKILFIFALIFAVISSNAQDKMRTIPGDINKLQLPSFDEKTGFREWEVFGDKVKFISEDEIIVNDMRLEMFTLDSAQKKKATFTSPLAVLSRITKSAKSQEPLFVQGDTFNLKGYNWKWSGENRFVSLSKDVNVDFTAKRNEKKEPETLNITSNYASMDYKGDENLFDFQNSVKVVGEDFTIFCQELKTQSPKKSETNGIESLKEITANGKVKMRYKDGIIANSEFVKMTPSSGIVDMQGNPEIINESSKDSVWGDRIVFTKSNSTAIAYSTPDKSVRAHAVIYAKESEKSEAKAATIYADTIKMIHSSEKNTFYFTGNVEVKHPDFTANAAEIEATSYKDSKTGKQEISKIYGKKNVRFLKDGKVATSSEIEIYPATMEVWLKNNARLVDPERGVRLFADKISMLQKDNYANAFSDTSDKSSFVRLEIDESGDVGIDKKSRSSVILSKNLSSQKDTNDIVFTFNRNVNIVSEDILAKCDLMDVIAEKDARTNKNSIRKIEAFNNVEVSQNGSQAKAQLAKIYPKVDGVVDGLKISRRMMELGISQENPKLRPQMILPEISNIGLDSKKSKTPKQKTVVESDSQYYVSGKESDSYVFEKNVKITGTDFSATCDKIETSIKINKQGKREISHIRLTGNVEVKQGGKIANAGKADIYPEEEMITLSDSPTVLNEDGSRANGTRMIYTKGKKSISIENPIITLPKMKD